MCSNMRARIVTSAVIVAALAVGLSGQAANKSAWSVPRMPDGHPDMQGVWANNGMTPLERPAVWGNRATMTDAELADLKKRAQKLIDGGDAFFADELDSGRARRQDQVLVSRYADRQLRPDLAVRAHLGQPDVAHHRPAGWPHSAARAGSRRARTRTSGRATRPWSRRSRAGPESEHALRPRRHTQYPRRLSELLRHHAGPWRRRAAHRDDPRRAHLPIGGGPHVSSAIRQYHGDSRAHWDGDTLVVDTINFSNAGFRGSTDQLHLTEKFRRVAEDTLEYYLTIDDPTVWSRPWTLMIPSEADRRGAVRIRLPRRELRAPRDPERGARARAIDTMNNVDALQTRRRSAWSVFIHLCSVGSPAHQAKRQRCGWDFAPFVAAEKRLVRARTDDDNRG